MSVPASAPSRLKFATPVIIDMLLRLFLAPAFAAMVSIIILRCYPLTRAKALETRRLLEARRGAL